MASAFSCSAKERAVQRRADRGLRGFGNQAAAVAIAAADLVRGSRNPLNDQWSDTLQRATLRREAKQ